MSWESIIKNVRDTPMGDMEEAERNAERIRREMESEDYDGRSRATRITVEKVMRDLDEAGNKLGRIVSTCEEVINSILRNPEMVDAKYTQELLEDIRNMALGRK